MIESNIETAAVRFMDGRIPDDQFELQVQVIIDERKEARGACHG
jgi:hypothetical protein